MLCELSPNLEINPIKKINDDSAEYTQTGGTLFARLLRDSEHNNVTPTAETNLIDRRSPSPRSTVLVIEDEGFMRYMIGQKLTRGGFQVIEAASGTEALQKLDLYTGVLSLVLSDIVMPGMSGKDAVAQIRITRPSVRVLYMSGYPSDFIAFRGVLEDGASFLEKTDIIGDGLLQKVRDMINP